MQRMWWVGFVCLVLVGCSDDAEGSGAGADAGTEDASLEAGDCDCDDGVYCNGYEVCDPDNPAADTDGCVRTPRDCDDQVACTTDMCSETVGSCLHVAPDEDGDGHGDSACTDPTGEPQGDDCDDGDDAKYPGSLELCDDDGADEDCDPQTFGSKDDDGDQSIDARCFNLDADGTRFGGLDCDDTDLAVHGRQLELCDSVDNDCDSTVDEYPSEVPWYPDGDGDGFGSGSDVVVSCAPIGGRSILGSDCDDEAPNLHPGAVEQCDGDDNDCDTRIDEGLAGCSTSGEPTAPVVNPCLNGLDDCSTYASCADTDDGFSCTCDPGFRGDGHGPAGCTDVDECAGGAVLACGAGATSCLNGLGSFACFCAAGFDGTGAQACVDIDECAVGNGGCSADLICTNTAPGRTCEACPAGYLALGAAGCAPTLTDLTLSAGALTPQLAAGQPAYQADVGLAADVVTLTPSAPVGATITIAGTGVASGAAWPTPALNLGANTFTIIVSESGHPSRQYSVTLTRSVPATFVKHSNPDDADMFGDFVSLSDDGLTMAVSAGGEDGASTGINGDQTNNSAANAGAVYVFQRTASGWAQQAYIKASNTDAGDRFGRSVVLSGDGNTLAVNGYMESSASTNGDQADDTAASAGAVYVYTRSNGAWSQQAYLKSDTPLGAHLFGGHLALSRDGNTLVAGAAQDDGNGVGVYATYTSTATINEAGAAYVFERSSGLWKQTAYLKASNPGTLDYFGGRVAVAGDGNTVVVGALGEGSNAVGINGDQTNNSMTRAGAVYVFVRSGGSWVQQAYVKASNTNAQDNFGSGLDLSHDGNLLAVGAFQESSIATGIGGDQASNARPNAGAVYLFSRAGTAWTQTAYIKASNTDADDNFGSGVALSSDGSRMAVSAPGEASASADVNANQTDNTLSQAGAVYLFSRVSGSWAQTTYVKAPNPGTDDQFGLSLALSGNGVTLAVGAPGESSVTIGVGGTPNEDGTDVGAIYVY